MSVWAWVGICVGGLLALGVVGYLILLALIFVFVVCNPWL